MPLAIILVFVSALVLSLPLMILLLLYNFFGNCRNMIDKNMVDSEEFLDQDIEDLVKFEVSLIAQLYIT